MALLYIRILVGAALALIGAGLLVASKGRRPQPGTVSNLALCLIGAWLITGGRVKGWGLEGEAESFGELARILGSMGPASHSLDELAMMYPLGVEAWWKQIQYRIDLRSDLTKICRSVGGRAEGPNPSFEDVLLCGRQREVFDENTAHDIDRIRCYTHYAEWRAGKPPDHDDVVFVLKNAPRLAKQVNAIKEELRARGGLHNVSNDWKPLKCSEELK